MTQALFQPMQNATNGSPSNSSHAWMQQSVQQFLSGFNWDNQPPQEDKVLLSNALDSDAPPSLLLTVNQFLSSIPWEGRPLNPSASPLPEDSLAAVPASESFTLDDFSELF